MASPNLNRPKNPFRIGTRNLTVGDNESLRSVLAAYKVRRLLGRL